MAAIRCSFLTTLTRRPATAALTAAAASGRAAGPATLRAGHLAAVVRRVGTLHGAAIVCSAGGSSGSDEGWMEVQLKVDGMVCDGCSSRVEEALAKMAGVKKVHVDLDKGLATVALEAASQMDAFAAVQPLAEAIKGLGFDAEPHFGEA
ncbi:hypothetical protein ABPG77_007028 [Micractinium sp. CCAP 211/92]